MENTGDNQWYSKSAEPDSDGGGVRLQTVDQLMWPLGPAAIALLKIRIDELALWLDVPLQEWHEDGLGPALGFAFRLPTGEEYMLEELAFAVKYHGIPGPTVYVEEAKLLILGAEHLLAEFLAALRLAGCDVADLIQS